VLVELDLPAVFVGGANPRHRAYVEEFAALVERSPNLTWIRSLQRERVLSLYTRARLHVLASWYEVVPLVDLEAALAGCPLVTTTRGYTNEYLGDLPTYWDPASGKEGLRAALERAPSQRIAADERARLRERLSWSATTRELVPTYRRLLER
jgi:glycosyltransferase involved in cell wall biosynthesis